jgi:hypothetical protein
MTNSFNHHVGPAILSSGQNGILRIVLQIKLFCTMLLGGFEP